MKGFVRTHNLAEMADFYGGMGGWIAAGKSVSRETVRDRIRRSR